MTVKLSAAANADIRRIIQQGLEQFGPKQVADYIDGLEHTFELLAEFPESGLARPEYDDGRRSFNFQSHVIFYRSEKETVFITRIRHAREDWQDN